MFHHQPFASVSHDNLHSFTYILCRLPIVVDTELEATFDFIDTRSEVTLSEFEGFMDKGLAIEIEEVKNFDWTGNLAESKNVLIWDEHLQHGRGLCSFLFLSEKYYYY